MSDLNLFQQLYCLSMVSNVVSQSQGSEQELERKMKQELDEGLPKLPGQWVTSWGPRVFKEKNPTSSEGGPDNVWYAAVEKTRKICVVSISGTARNSLADIVQDILVQEVVDFNAWVKQWSSSKGIPKPQTGTPNESTSSTTAYCAKGTCLGAWNVLRNTGTAADKIIRIDQYLSSLDKSYSIVFAGHSLGGALSPVVALGLLEANMVGSHDVKVLPSAGPSPGNDKLSLDYAERFPKTPASATDYQVFNMDYYNALDIVPQAWSLNPAQDRNLDNILTKILHLGDEVDETGKLSVELAKYISGQSKVQYTPIPGQMFTGPPTPEVIHSWKDVKEVIGREHVRAYWDEIGITDFLIHFERKFRSA
ncbi:hypothetical protein M426DRAFT_10125 [Hypoxylon sp. CI-4A]|nr:hypothetical protein M426DRAFT_10125 [Hypoxylon sp. CI-4A]